MQNVDFINYFVILFIMLGVFLLGLNEYRKIPEDVEDIKLDEIKKIVFLYTILAVILVVLWEILLDFVNIGFKVVDIYHGKTETDF